jgi:quercetin dioxygenase-like cupin family protein
MTAADTSSDSSSDTDTGTAIDTTVCRAEDLPWAEPFPGIELKVLRTGEGSGRYTPRTRFAPGTVLPKHVHHGEVHAFTLAGRWGYLEYDWESTAGDYVYEEPGSVHSLVVPADSEDHAVIQFVIDQGMDFLDADGNVFHSEDAESITKMYVDSLAAVGVHLPGGILP